MYTSPTAMSILLVRHGETASNAARILQFPDVPLSDRGLAQAERVATRLAGLGAEGIVSSDYARAQMTAERVQAATGASAEDLKALCRQAPNVRAHVDGREIVKEIVVPGKLVNLVVR